MAQTVPHLQESFAGGEWDPQLQATVGLAKYKIACRVMRNFFAHVNGKASNRPGLIMAAQTMLSTTNQSAVQNVRVIPFIFNTSQCYVLEFGHLYMRVLKNGKLIMNGSVPFSITTPYTSAMVMQLGYTQSADTVFLAHPSVAPQMVQRISDTNWTIQAYPYTGGPWLLDNTNTSFNIQANTTYGQSLAVNVGNSGGMGYRLNDIVTLIQSGASGGQAIVNVVNSALNSVTFNQAGTGYQLNDILTVVQAGASLGTATVTTVGGGGAITSLSLTAGGSGYYSANGLALSGGHGANATANITAGVITGVSLYAGGTGYVTQNNLTTSGGSGTGATISIFSYGLIPVGANVTLAASGFTPFVSGHVGALWELFHYVPNQSIGSYQMTSSAPTPTISCGGTWRLVTNGTWTGSVWVEKSLDGGKTWLQLNQYYGVNNFNINTYGTEDMSNNAPPFLVRVNSSGFSGTADITLTADPFIQPGMVKVTSFQNSTTVYGVVTQPIGLSNTPTSDWAEGAWSTYRGWPSTCEFTPDDRLAWANTPYQPITSFISKTSNYFSFNVSSPLVDSDALNVNLPSRQLNAINNLVPLRAVLALTSGGEWSIESTQGVTAPLTPSTVYQRVHGYEGSTSVRPLLIGIRALFVQALGKVIRDVGYELIYDSFVGANISLFSNHLFYWDNIIDMCYCQNPDSLVWIVMASGDLVSLTYLREQNVVTFSRHDTYGKFMSTCAIFDTVNNYNVPYFVVNRANGQFIEYMPKRMQTTNIQDQYFVDNGGIYDALGQTFQNANLDTFSLGPNAAPDYWTLSQSGTVSQATAPLSGQLSAGIPVITNVENGKASTCLQGTNPILYQRMDQAYGSTYWQGRAVTFNAFVRCFKSNCAYVSIYDGVNTYQSSAHPGDGSWQLLSITATINVTASQVAAQCQVLNGTAYFNNSYFNSGVSSISGLSYLNGQTVTILADGFILPTTVVQNGVLSWAGGANYNKVIYGLPYVAQLQPVTPYFETPPGSMQGRTINIGKAVVGFWNTASGKIGTNFDNMKPIPDLQIINYDPPAPPLMTGPVSLTIGGGYSTENSICIQQDDPLPMTVTHIVTEMQVGGIPAIQ